MDKNILDFKQRLDKFIDKYYKNQLIKGGILTLVLVSVIGFVAILLEYFSYFPGHIRLFLLLFTLVSFGFISTYFLILPLFRLLKIFKRITYKHTASIIKEQFPEVKDKIINVLELNNYHSMNELVMASIDQKIEETKKYDFNLAINYRSNKNLIKYIIAVGIVYLLSYLVQPNLFKSGAERIVHFNTEYEKDIGFRVIVDTSKLYIEKGNDFLLHAHVSGENIPEQLFLKVGNDKFLMEKINDNEFSYPFKNVNQAFNFQFSTNKYQSRRYKLNILESPILIDYKVTLNFPEYTMIDNKEIINVSDFDVPRGTKIKFQFNTKDVDSLFIIKDSTRIALLKDKNTFTHELIATQSFNYTLNVVNAFFSKRLLNNSSLIVVPDFYPSIEVNQMIDENKQNVVYFKGQIQDDYGFSKLAFILNDKEVSEISINGFLQEQEFYYAYEFGLNEKTNFNYFFKVSDNDYVLGPKSTKSQIFSFNVPKKSEIIRSSEEMADKIEEKIDKGLFMAKELSKDVEEIQKSLINKNLKEWEKKELLSNLEKKQKQLEELVKQIAQNNNEKINKENSYNELGEEIRKKQEQLQKMMENVMNDEIKKLMEELRKLQSEFDEKQLNELAEDLKYNYEELSKELDKNLELLKRFEIEKNINNVTDELEQLAKEHKKNLEKIDNKSANRDSIISKNENIKKELEELKDIYNELLDKNEQLEKPFDLEDFNKEFDEVAQDIEEDNKDILSKEKESKEKSEQTNEKMKKLADNMQMMMESNQTANEGENAETLRQILENLIAFSFEQENLLQQIRTVSLDNPKFINLTKEQLDLKDDFEIVKDSLYELSKRTSHLGTHISNTTFNIEDKLFDINDYLKDRKIGNAVKDQQFAMKYSNDLILLLAESLKNMESMGGGGGSKSNNKKKKPNKGKPSLSEMRESQESMKKQLEKMLNEMKNGQQKGGQPKAGELGKMLAKQEIFQQMLNELSQGNVGKETAKKLQEIKQMMEQNKRDIINMKINQNTLNRQHQIVTRLLEAENAEMERDKDEERKSREAGNYEIKYPEKMFEQNKENINFNETLYRNSILLKDFYKLKYQKYMKRMNN